MNIKTLAVYVLALLKVATLFTCIANYGSNFRKESWHYFGRYFTLIISEYSLFHMCRLIRLEFNSEGCGYYTELDAVELVGELPSGMP